MTKTKKTLCIVGAAVLLPVLVIVIVVNVTLSKIKRIDGYEQSMTEEEYSAQNAAEEEAAKWLEANSWKFGFILRFPQGKEDITGIIFEPWHFRYVGRYHAQRIYDAGKGKRGTLASLR